MIGRNSWHSNHRIHHGRAITHDWYRLTTIRCLNSLLDAQLKEYHEWVKTPASRVPVPACVVSAIFQFAELGLVEEASAFDAVALYCKAMTKIKSTGISITTQEMMTMAKLFLGIAVKVVY